MPVWVGDSCPTLLTFDSNLTARSVINEPLAVTVPGLDRTRVANQLESFHVAD